MHFHEYTNRYDRESDATDPPHTVCLPSMPDALDRRDHKEETLKQLESLPGLSGRRLLNPSYVAGFSGVFKLPYLSTPGTFTGMLVRSVELFSTFLWPARCL